MSVLELVDEQVSEQYFHVARGSIISHHDDSYGFSIGEYLNKFDLRSLIPILTRAIENFDPPTSQCAETIFHVASATLSDLDNTRVRLRSSQDGRKAIVALEIGVDKLRKAGFNEPNHERAFLFNLAHHHLEMAKGTNIRDEMIRATLEARHKVKMDESEYLEFSNFLTSVDPQYPTWSDVGEYGPPTLVKDSGRYFEAYNRFKAGKAPK